MPQLTKNQSGFTTVEAVLIIVVLLIVSGTGAFVYHASKKTNQTLTSAAKDASASPSQATKKTAATTKNGAAAANTTGATTASTAGDLVTLGRSLYTSYFGGLAKGDTRQQALALVKNDFSASAYSQLADFSGSYDPLTCTTTTPSTYTVEAIDASGNTLQASDSAKGAILNFTPTDRQDGSATLQVATSPVQITDVSCPN